jgi:hypothetical protein|tara:strand:- start:23 stop:862 length:840 start_codon:yes stop_codon:yes gene_type:complete
VEDKWWEKDKPQWHEENQQDPPSEANLAEQQRIVQERYREEPSSSNATNDMFPKSIVIVVVVLVIGVILIGFAASSVGDMGSDEEWLPVDSKIDAKYPGFDWIEREKCYTDDWGDTYCEYWDELECWVDLDVSYIVENTTYHSQFEQYHIRNYEEAEEAEEECLEYGQNGTMMVGTNLEIFYNSNDPSDARLEPPMGAAGILLIFCGIGVLFGILALVGAMRGDWGTSDFRRSSPGITFNIGGRGSFIGRGRRHRKRSRKSRSGSRGRSGGGRSGGGGR